LEGEEVTYGEFLSLPNELENPSILHVFEVLFFPLYIKNVILFATNHQMEGEEVFTLAWGLVVDGDGRGRSRAS
jgi:hypothetical protein